MLQRFSFSRLPERATLLRTTGIVAGISGFTFVALHSAQAERIIEHAASVSYKCAMPTACVTASNTAKGPGVSTSGSSGAGLVATSKTGSGVVGTTGGSTTGVSAIMGTDQSLSGDANSGIQGTSALGKGVAGYSTSGFAVYAQSNNAGVVAFAGSSGSGTAVLGNALSSTGTAFSGVATGQGYVLVGINGSNDQDVASIDSSGNEILAGTLTQSGQPAVRTGTTAGKPVVAYADRTSQPTVEDFGEARLSDGRAYVSLESTFAQTVDPRAKYMVFLTPQGDSRGLFVSTRSGRGFEVHENGGGHSSLTFDYRIVAKPFDTNGARLAPTTAYSGLVHGRKLPQPQRVPAMPAAP
jgi:hypothetical protein